MQKPRSRRVYVCLMALTVILGLASRHFSPLLPLLLSKNAGDILYATMAVWLIGFSFPALPTLRAALAALFFCFAIELLKFCSLPWLVAARHSTAGGLVLGHGFHASNLVCYGLGAALAAGIEVCVTRTQV